MTLQAEAEIDKLTSEFESNKKDNEKRMTELQEELSKTQKEQTRMEETSKVEGATAVEKVRAKMNAKVENLNLGHCIWRSLGSSVVGTGSDTAATNFGTGLSFVAGLAIGFGAVSAFDYGAARPHAALSTASGAGSASGSLVFGADSAPVL